MRSSREFFFDKLYFFAVFSRDFSKSEFFTFQVDQGQKVVIRKKTEVAVFKLKRKKILIFLNNL